VGSIRNAPCNKRISRGSSGFERRNSRIRRSRSRFAKLGRRSAPNAARSCTRAAKFANAVINSAHARHRRVRRNREARCHWASHNDRDLEWEKIQTRFRSVNASSIRREKLKTNANVGLHRSNQRPLRARGRKLARATRPLQNIDASSCQAHSLRLLFIKLCGLVGAALFSMSNVETKPILHSPGPQGTIFAGANFASARKGK
jgi:hypothetical protein